VISWPAEGRGAMRTRLAVRIYNAVQRSIGSLGRAPARFAESEQALLDAAREATGISEFGSGAWIDGFRVLLDGYDREARLTPFGRRMVRQELIGVLCARLLSQAGWQQHPACLTTQIRRPIFVLGLPRSGTTALHRLLGQDPANQVLEFWLAAAPGPRPPRHAWRADPRHRAAVRALRTMYWLDPGLKAIHWMTADGPEECRHLLQQSFTDDTFDSNATLPSYTKWFGEQDPRVAYARHRDVLRLVGSPTPDRRWVLKYPAHIRNLDVVLETYPDACFVQTHRDPARVLPSLCSLVAGWRSLYEGEIDPRAIGRWQLDMWATLMERGLEQRRAIPSERFFDLHFGEVASDPVGAVRRVYDHFGFDWDEEVERRMRAWHQEDPQGRYGAHRYRAERFGLSEDAMAERFARYREGFGVARETPG